MRELAYIKRSNGEHWVGDGFPVKSIFSYHDIAKDISPFLLMDYAAPTTFPPTTQKLGVGPHPHRGFETVTIVYEGGVAHRDSSGGGGAIGPGDVQWMTAASGILHEEYHSPEYASKGGPFEMVQLWVNLAAKDKMAAPRYQSITADRSPEVTLPEGAGTARIIAGELDGVTGPAQTFSPMNVWDLRLKGGHRAMFDLPEGYTTALFVLRGTLRFDERHDVHAAELAVLERDGGPIEFDVTEDSTVLLLNGAPLIEPIVGHGPFVMNSDAEIQQAIDDFNNGRFGTFGR